MINWIREKLGITKLETIVNSAIGRVNKVEWSLDRHTVAHVDHDPNGRSTVILIGRFRNRDYVETIDVTGKDFQDLVTMLRARRIGRVDAGSPVLRAVLERS